MKRLKWIFLFSIITSLTTFGQEGNYYYGCNSKMVQSKIEAITHKEVKKKSENRYIVKTYIKQGNDWTLALKERIHLIRPSTQKITYNAGTFFPRRIKREMVMESQDKYTFVETKKNVTLRSGISSKFLPLHLEGTVTQNHKNGRLKSISIFQDNQLISNENWLKDGSRYIDSIFYSVEKEPVYQMDNVYFKNYILSKIAEAKISLEDINDEIIIGFVIMETGQIQGVHTLQGRSLEFNAFLESAITHLPGEWNPALLNGSPVRYFKTIPLNFIHDKVNIQHIELSSGILHINSY